MKDYTEIELETKENVIIDFVDKETQFMGKQNKLDLLEMIMDSLETRMQELYS